MVLVLLLTPPNKKSPFHSVNAGFAFLVFSFTSCKSKNLLWRAQAKQKPCLHRTTQSRSIQVACLSCDVPHCHAYPLNLDSWFLLTLLPINESQQVLCYSPEKEQVFSNPFAQHFSVALWPVVKPLVYVCFFTLLRA